MMRDYLYLAAAAAGLMLSLGSGIHAVLNKRDPRSQLGWLVLCIFLPAIGVVAYWTLGVNRIVTRAKKWHELGLFEKGPGDDSYQIAEASLAATRPEWADTMGALNTISGRVTRRPLLGGNQIDPLFNGEQAYPPMLEAIDAAESYIYFCTYLFDTPGIGQTFIDALGRASERGVRVLVLLDALGERYSRPRASKLLREWPKVEVARFLPFGLSRRGINFNLRNHRKLVVVDGNIGFTGGMNIGQRHMVDDPDNDNKTQDVHFRVLGPAIYALEHVFLEDWWFVNDCHSEPPGRCALAARGDALCRGIKDGPNEDFEALQWILVGALSCARSSIKIMTPYFIPGRELLAALTAAALRGVAVDVVLPRENNLPFVAWASQSMLAEVLQFGVRVHYQPPPFNHAKLFLVDDFYANIGSANLDPRSLQLNFEFNLEVYDPDLGQNLATYFDAIVRKSESVTEERLASRGFWLRLRDSVAKIFAPYL